MFRLVSISVNLFCCQQFSVLLLLLVIMVWQLSCFSWLCRIVWLIGLFLVISICRLKWCVVGRCFLVLVVSGWLLVVVNVSMIVLNWCRLICQVLLICCGCMLFLWQVIMCGLFIYLGNVLFRIRLSSMVDDGKFVGFLLWYMLVSVLCCCRWLYSDWISLCILFCICICRFVGNCGVGDCCGLVGVGGSGSLMLKLLFRLFLLIMCSWFFINVIRCVQMERFRLVLCIVLVFGLVWQNGLNRCVWCLLVMLMLVLVICYCSQQCCFCQCVEMCIIMCLLLVNFSVLLIRLLSIWWI